MNRAQGKSKIKNQTSKIKNLLLLTVLLGSAFAPAQLAPPKRTNKTYTKRPRQPFQPPHFADAKARAVTYSMLRAERTLGPVRIKISGEGGNALIAWNRGSIRQDGHGGSWVYKTRTLTVACPKGFFQGAATHADTLDYLAMLTGGADTMARQLLLRQHPFEDFFTPDSTVRLTGVEGSGPDRADIVQISNRMIRASLFVRRRDHLVLSAEADTLSPSGKVVYRASRSYVYKPLTNPGSVFHLSHRRGAKVKPLPKSAIKFGKFSTGG